MRDTIRFGDFVEVNPSIRLEKGKEYPYVEMADVIPGNAFVFPEKQRVYKGGGSRFKAGDTLFARITPCLENGKIVRLKHTVNQPCFGSTEFFVFRGKPNISDSTYIFYLALSPMIRDPAVKSMTGASGRQRAILSSVEDIHVPAYPLPTQRKIAAILSTYDDLIENNTRRIKILEDMAQTLYREWFIYFRFPGHENVSMVGSALGPIPQGWKIGELGNLAESIRRNVKPGDVEPETPYFGLEHLPRKSIALSNWDFVDSINSAKLRFKKGEILFGKIRPYFHKVGVAPLDGICSSDTIVIHPKVNKYFAITLSYVSSEHFIKYATTTSQGSKMPRADWKVLAKYPVIIPPEQIMRRFSSFVCEVVDNIHNLIFQNKNLSETRDLLLPKLISGEIDVSELDIDTNGMQPVKSGTHIPYPLTDRLHADEKILGGKPVIKGTRLGVEFILDLLEQGWHEEEVLENYPSLAREDIEACRAYQEKVTRASVSR